MSGVEKWLADQLEPLRVDIGAVGMTLAVANASGDHVEGAAGWTSIERRELMQATAVMPSGSVGKPIAAATLLSLIEENGIALDTKIRDFLSAHDGFDALPNAQDITIRMLLTHTSGLPDFLGTEIFRASTAQIFSTRRRAGPLRIGEIADFLRDTPPLGRPGQIFSYSETGYYLIGHLIETLSGTDYYEQARQRVTEPAAMTRTYPGTQKSVPGLVAGHPEPEYGETESQGGRKRADSLNVTPAEEWSGGGFLSNARDIALFASAYFSNTFFSDDLLKDLESDLDRFVREDPLTTIGPGFFRFSSELGPGYRHAGYFPGYQTVVMFYGRPAIAVALQKNSSFSFSSYSAGVTSANASAREASLRGQKHVRRTGATASDGDVEQRLSTTISDLAKRDDRFRLADNS